MRIAAFDVSSTTIGWAIFDIKNNKPKLICFSHIKPNKRLNLFQCLSDTRNQIISILKKYNVEQVAIEDIISYMPGQSSANTIIKLALFNRIIGMTVLEQLKEPPIMYGVLAIRHGLKLSKELPKKEDMPAVVEKHLNIKLPPMLKKTGKIKDEYFDQADAISVGLHHCRKLLNIKNDYMSVR